MLHRPATEADIPSLHRIYSSDRVAPFVAFDPGDIESFAEVLREWRADGEVLVVEDDDGVIAAYVVRRKQRRLAHAAYIGSVAVAPERQGRGVGTSIMRELLGRLLAEGRSRIELFVSADNPRAIALYRKLGFEVEGTHRRFFRRAGEDAFVDEFSMALLAPHTPDRPTDAGLFTGKAGDAEPRPVDRSTAEHYVWGQGCDGWRLARSVGLSVIEERMPGGASEVRHYHAAARQFFYVLSGALTLELDGARHELRAGRGLEIPPGRAHQASNRCDAPAEFLVISAPSTRGDRHTADG